MGKRHRGRQDKKPRPQVKRGKIELPMEGAEKFIDASIRDKLKVEDLPCIFCGAIRSRGQDHVGDCPYLMR